MGGAQFNAGKGLSNANEKQHQWYCHAKHSHIREHTEYSNFAY
jgi:hypothetical protein